ncbi:MAG TPA: hypothetical protein VN634_08680 [Candidatus Limnocylindrales bacterium]|nr:hypothetical protein [Candidatus Limnocylindrales bacterium]
MMTESATEPRLLTTSEPQAQSEIDALGSGLKDLEMQARAFVHERPIVAVLVAAGLGYLLARLASRTSR